MNTTKAHMNGAAMNRLESLGIRQAAIGTKCKPLSFAQQRLWFLDQLEPNSPLYNISVLARLSGALSVPALEEALNIVIARHEALRTRFICPNETPLQAIDPHLRVELRFTDLTLLPKEKREQEAQTRVREETNRPFNLSAEPLIRPNLFRIGLEEHQLLLVIHHIVADEWSLKVFFSELAAAYQGVVGHQPAQLPVLPIQYADYAEWQRNWLTGDVLHRQLAYWRKQLGNCLPVTQLPTDYARGQASTFRGSNAWRLLDADLGRRIQQVAQKYDVTLFMVLLAALKTLLFRYTHQEELTVCSPIAGRSKMETEGLIGFFVNTLPLRTNLGGDPSFEQLLHQVREVTLGAYDHQDLPFEKMVEELRPERSLSHMPFSRVMFVVQNNLLERIALPGLKVEFVQVESDQSKFDTTLIVQETSQGLRVHVEYSRELFEAATIARLLGHFETLLQGIVANPSARVSELPLLSPNELHQILVEWNSTAADYPRDKSIQEVFEDRVEAAPEAIALRFGQQVVSYRELNARANQLARYLKQLKVGPEVPVGLCMMRSAEMVTGLLAILKAGGAYVPLEPNYPKERLAFMLEDTQAPVVLAHQSLISVLPKNAAKIVWLDTDWELISRESRQNPPNVSGPESLAYVMYTSGSTGQPKGVAVPHRAVNRLVLNSNYLRLDATDRIAQVSNIAFDAATFEIWGALLNGAELVGITSDIALSPRDFSRELSERGITAMFLTSALFSQLAAEVPGAFENLRTLIAGGEALDCKWVRAVLNYKSPRRLLNGYGPTENTTFTCCHELQRLEENASNVPIGRPIANTQVYILDPHLNPVPIGVVGELYTGGDGLANGYWNRPELTAEKFVPNPFGQDGPSFLYRTGDLARFLPDGVIEFLGRIDHQVKIRGFRIELGEIEAVMGQHPEVVECVVIAEGNTTAARRLVAYVVPKGERAPTSSELRVFLSERLPDYMVPSVFVSLRALPLTSNGKVDRKALPTPDQVRPDLEKEYCGPRDEVERQLARIWERVLEVSPIGIQDKFFDLGGHSLMAVRVIAQIEKALGRKLRLATIFQAPTIEQLAAIIRGEVKEASVVRTTSLVDIQTQGKRPPLYLVHGAGGGMFWGYINLARFLGPDQPVYAFKSRALDGRAELSRIEELAAQYLSDLRAKQPQGPYYLGGYCFGGNVAFEMARQLTAQNQTVAFLGLLNCAPPNSRYNHIPWTPRWALRFAQNLLYWANYVRQWSPTQRREFFLWKVSLLKKKVGKFLHRSGCGPDTFDAREIVDLSAYTEDQRKIWEAHIRGLVNFHPQTYPGRVHLFRSPGHPFWCSFDPDYGWGDLAAAGVSTEIVPGAHEKILEEPCVEIVATKLKQALESAQRLHLPEKIEANRFEPSTVTTLKQIGVSVPKSQADLVEFWRKQLAGAPQLLELPSDGPRPAQGVFQLADCPVDLPYSGLEPLPISESGKQHELFDVLLGTFVTLLHRYTNATDLVIGTLAPFTFESASDGGARTDRNLVPLRCDLEGDPTFSELLNRLRRVRESALAHSGFSFATLVDRLYEQQKANYAPVFQILLCLEEEPEATNNAAGNQPALAETQDCNSNYDLILRLNRTANGLTGRIEYSAALFAPDRIRRMIGHFNQLFGAAVSRAHERISVLPLLTDEEKHTLLLEWNNTERPYPQDKSLVDLFLEQVARTPKAEAVVSGTCRLTYEQLSARAGRIAAQLQRLGAGNDSLVGICLERSPDLVAAILATLGTGAAYVPLDPAYPAERLGFVFEDAQLRIIVTQSKLLGLLPKTNAAVLCLDAPASEETADVWRSKPASHSLAYVIYTSGSTGKPKGVALEHRGAVALVDWARHVFAAEELSGVLASTSVCFDLSVFEIFVPLSLGGKIILADNALALANLPAANEVTLINTVPSAMRELLRLKAVPDTVQIVNLAGEPLGTELVDQIYGESAVRKVYDLYGPTETTTYSTFTLREAGKPATIGRPLANEQVYLLDRCLQLVPIGIPGELYIGGAGVARGYLNRPELTAEKFIPHPFKTGERLYRTGDLARWKPDGNLEYLGRIDHQVKIRGFRIELGEIEAALKAQEQVRDAVVLAREDHPGEKQLVGYVVREVGIEIKANDLRQKLRQTLPEYMVPAAFVFLEAWPMTPNGKLDRKALPAPDVEMQATEQEFIAPRNELEKKLANIWIEVLHLKKVSVNQSFFDIGGHSLTAICLLSRVRDVFKVSIPLSSLFSTPTIASFAHALAAPQPAASRPSMPPLQRVPREGKLPVSFVQERLWFLDQLEPGSDAYNVPIALRLRGELDLAALQEAADGIVSRHEALRTSFRYAEGQLTQIIASNGGLKIEFVDKSNAASRPAAQLVQELVDREAQQPFDLSAGPLARATLIRVNKMDHVFVLVMHHTISDGWSLALFFQELATRYAALTSNRSAPPIVELSLQYADFASWERHWMRGEVLEQELAYWRGTLAGAPSEIALPTDRTNPEQPTRRADRRVICLDHTIEASLGVLGRVERCTPFIILMAALHITLQKWASQEDLVIGTVVAGRNRSELENLIGCFMNFLPIRANGQGAETAKQVLGRVRTAVLESQNHQECPFEKIVEAINPRRRHNQNPLYNVALLSQNFPTQFFASESLQASRFPVSMQAALLDLRFEAERAEDGLCLSCEYKADLFEVETIEELLVSYKQVLSLLLRNPDARLSEFKLTAALEERAKAARARERKPTIAIAGTFTCEPIAEPLEFWLRQLDQPASLKFAPYNQVFQQLLDPTSDLSCNALGLNVLLVRPEDWQSPDHKGPADWERNLQRTAADFLAATKAAAARTSTPYLICFCPPSTKSIGEPLRAELLGVIEKSLQESLSRVGGVYVLTSAALAKWYPVTDYDDVTSEELAHVPYTPVFFTALATAVVRKFHALTRPAHKVIVLDCDQTLWSGVCGEDGPQGIKLDAERLGLQQFMRAQCEAGMLLCLCSKNNEQDVLEVFSRRLDMPLRREHFTSWRLNWTSKSENLKSLAKELQLGLESFIFIDDNPIECAEVEANCPEVLTLQLPEDTSLIPQFLEHAWVFDHLAITEEDARRAELYRQNQQREKLRAQAPTLSDFLAGLDLKVSLEPIAQDQWQRVAQLSQRTNQFNCTTRRFNEGELGIILARSQGLVVHVADRFGDYGLVGVILYEVGKQCFSVDSFMLSCRVLGRGVEHQMLSRLGQMAREQGADWVDVHFVPTSKNKPALGFLERVGADFKQPLNGGYVFRFPAGYAAEVTFQPLAEVTEPAPADTTVQSRVPPKTGALRKFAACRAIALEANNAAQIYQRMRAAAVVRPANGTNFVAARTELERSLCDLWANLLHVERVGLKDDFFELGGHSLLAVRLFAEIEKLTGRKFPLVTVFQAPTVELLARVMAQDPATATPSLLVPIRSQGSRPPLFLIHGAGGDVLWGYANLAQHLSPDQPVFGIKSRGQAGLQEYAHLQQMATFYLQVVRQYQPQGPYYLGGYCFGGNVAYEMARQLHAEGQQVGLVALLDSAPANAGYETFTWWRPSFLWRFSRNLGYWLKDFSALTPTDRHSFFLRKFRAFARRVARRLRPSSGPVLVDIEEVIDPRHVPAHERKLWQTHLQALIDHIEQPYSGQVVLLRTRGQPLFCSLEEDFCWRNLARGGVKTVLVPGSHESVFIEPNVQHLAKELNLLLLQAQRGAGGKHPDC